MNLHDLDSITLASHATLIATLQQTSRQVAACLRKTLLVLKFAAELQRVMCSAVLV